MRIRFLKMHGAGNDFVLVDDREGTFPAAREVLAAIGARGTGVGCEGIILVQKSDRLDFRMKFFNPDGSEAEMCGNGARCVAAFAREIGAVASDRMRFETIAGLVQAEVLNARLVKIWLPDPKDLRADFVNSGVPHRIVPVEDLEGVDLVPSDLVCGSAKIPSSAVDLKVVAVVWKYSTAWMSIKQRRSADDHALIPCMLVHDEKLIVRDDRTMTNWLRGDYEGGVRYINMSTADCPERFNDDLHPVRDAKRFVPCSLQKGKYKQFMLTAHVAKGTKPGLYTGAIALVENAGKTLAEAYRYASKTWFPPTSWVIPILRFLMPRQVLR